MRRSRPPPPASLARARAARDVLCLLRVHLFGIVNSCLLPPPGSHLTPHRMPSFRLGRTHPPCPTPTSCSSVARGRAPRPSPLECWVWLELGSGDLPGHNHRQGLPVTAVQAFNANPAAADWKVSGVTDMGGLFYYLKNFNADLQLANLRRHGHALDVLCALRPVPCPQSTVESPLHAGRRRPRPLARALAPHRMPSLRLSAGRVGLRPAAELRYLQRHGHEYDVRGALLPVPCPQSAVEPPLHAGRRRPRPLARASPRTVCPPFDFRQSASAFNQPLSWDTSSVKSMPSMFIVRSSPCPAPNLQSIPPLHAALAHRGRPPPDPPSRAAPRLAPYALLSTIGRTPPPCPTPTSCSSVARGRATRPSPPLAMARVGVREAARERKSARVLLEPI